MCITFSKKNIKKNKESGFTLVELLVSVSLFISILTISLGAIVSIMDANRKSQTLRSVMDNLNSSMESINRTIRFGQNYHCGTSGTLSSPQDCATTPSDSLTVLDSTGNQVTFALSNSRLVKTVGGTNYYLTSPDMTIQSLSFFVFGSYPYSGGAVNDNLQPRVIVSIKGYVGTKANSSSNFVIETTISQRKFDYQ